MDFIPFRFLIDLRIPLSYAAHIPIAPLRSSEIHAKSIDLRFSILCRDWNTWTNGYHCALANVNSIEDLCIRLTRHHFFRSLHKFNNGFTVLALAMTSPMTYTWWQLVYFQGSSAINERFCPAVFKTLNKCLQLRVRESSPRFHIPLASNTENVTHDGTSKTEVNTYSSCAWRPPFLVEGTDLHTVLEIELFENYPPGNHSFEKTRLMLYSTCIRGWCDTGCKAIPVITNTFNYFTIAESAVVQSAMLIVHL